jgi:DNA polymerase I-like protein with 3'-5' exonuclease and polymerase domains
MKGIDYEQMAQAALGAWMDRRPPYIGVDTETEGVAFFDKAFAITISWPGADSGGSYFEVARQVPADAAREILSGTDTWVFHNAKFDLQKLILGGFINRSDLAERTVHDTEAIAHLLDENSGKRLKDLAITHLGWDDTIEVPLKSDPSKTRLVSREKYDLDNARRELKLRISDGFDKLPREVLIPYAIRDADFTVRLFDKLYPRLEVSDSGLQELYRREMELSLVLLDVEARGMGLDAAYVEETSRRVAGEMLTQELAIRKITKREEFVDHHEWIKSAFAEQGITLPDTQKATLADQEHPLAGAIVEYRRLKKLHSTYLSAMLAEQRDGVLHPGFRQHGTRTGRMSSGGVID